MLFFMKGNRTMVSPVPSSVNNNRLPEDQRIRLIIISKRNKIYEPDNERRNDFVRLVLILVLLMVMVTAVILTVILSVPGVRTFFLNASIFLILLPLFILMILNCVMSLTEIGRKLPCNIICLMLTVVAQTMLAGVITARYQTHIILFAVLTTAMVLCVCVVLASTKFDFTSYILYFVGIGVTVAMLSIILIMTMTVLRIRMKPVLVIVLMILTFMSVLTLIMDLQIVLGGKTIELNKQDYALGAFMLYTSLMDIFIRLVLLVGLLDSN